MQGLGTSSAIINGQLVPQARTQWWTPVATGPVIQGVPASPMQSTGISGSSGGGVSNGAAAAAAANPWSPVASPVPWMIGMFIVGYLMLRHVHWGY